MKFLIGAAATDHIWWKSRGLILRWTTTRDYSSAEDFFLPDMQVGSRSRSEIFTFVYLHKKP